MNMRAVIALLSFVVGCGEQQDRDGVGLDRASNASTPIINGEDDLTHPAVVAWLHGSKCTATIFHRAGSTGYALTAAHCVNPPLGQLHEGIDHNTPDRTYAVTATEVHPLYGTLPVFDVAVLTFAGADAATPVLPLLPIINDDDVSTGTVVDVVGFGVTEGGVNSRRKHRLMMLGPVSATTITVDQSAGGICAGDSGAAAALDVGGVEYLAAMGKGVDEVECNSSGFFVPIEGVRDGFILPVVNGTPIDVDLTCAQCTDAHILDGNCTDEVSGCLADGPCSAYLACRGGCDDDDCIEACKVAHPAGAMTYAGIDACLCGPSACEEACGDDSLCVDPPDAGVADAGFDGGPAEDGGTVDAGKVDGGLLDGGAEDGGLIDGGAADSGTTPGDAGPVMDGGGDVDAGDGPDAGGCTCASDGTGPQTVTGALLLSWLFVWRRRRAGRRR